jgi:hypothetical protein
MTECNQLDFSFHDQTRSITARFDGHPVTSDAGLLALKQTEANTGIIAQFAQCFHDHRDPQRIHFTVRQLLEQRVLGLCIGHEDLNDHEQWRHDPLLGALLGRQADSPLAGKSTLNRLELTPVTADAGSRYKKITRDRQAIERLFVDLYVQQHPQPPAQIVLDLDATDNPLHGDQPGGFFHGYYDAYCYLPLYIVAGDFVLAAKLRPGNVGAARGARRQLQQVVERLRGHWPGVRIVVRGDSGFCNDELMSYCEQSGLDYVLGMARNPRLLQAVRTQMWEASLLARQTGRAARVFTEFKYRTCDSWSHSRRVIAKAEQLGDKANPRFVVTNLPGTTWRAQRLYEDLYCERGEMENRIKETQLQLFAGRTSTGSFRGNQLRLWLSVVAHSLMQALRLQGLAGTALARAQPQTVRQRLLKLGATVRVTVRKVWVALSVSFPEQDLFTTLCRNLQAAGHRCITPTCAAPASG